MEKRTIRKQGSDIVDDKPPNNMTITLENSLEQMFSSKYGYRIELTVRNRVYI